MVTKKAAEIADSLQIQSHSNGELSVLLGGLLRRLLGGFSVVELISCWKMSLEWPLLTFRHGGFLKWGYPQIIQN
jgi:hypothetical protein